MSSSLADAFGKPREGIHAKRIAGLAFYDLLFTAIAAYLISPAQPVATFFGLWAVGVIAHAALGVKSALFG